MLVYFLVKIFSLNTEIRANYVEVKVLDLVVIFH